MRRIRYIGFLVLAFILNFNVIGAQEAKKDSVNIEEAGVCIFVSR